MARFQGMFCFVMCIGKPLTSLLPVKSTLLAVLVRSYCDNVVKQTNPKSQWPRKSNMIPYSWVCMPSMVFSWYWLDQAGLLTLNLVQVCSCSFWTQDEGTIVSRGGGRMHQEVWQNSFCLLWPYLSINMLSFPAPPSPHWHSNGQSKSHGQAQRHWSGGVDAEVLRYL